MQGQLAVWWLQFCLACFSGGRYEDMDGTRLLTQKQIPLGLPLVLQTSLGKALAR